ncbi:hypothetical protein C8R48DRAFT_673330 [Suillus tomentosus]|nr:hypothetical protein C8R48DRAFT_673330 [Suillus tomentosus]
MIIFIINYMDYTRKSIAAWSWSAILSCNVFLNFHSEDTGFSISKALSQYSKSYGVPASLAAQPRMTPALCSPLQWTYSENTRWLTPGERTLAQAHLAENAGETDQYSAKVSSEFRQTFPNGSSFSIKRLDGTWWNGHGLQGTQGQTSMAGGYGSLYRGQTTTRTTTSQDSCHHARTLATPDLFCQSASLQWSWSATLVPYHPWKLAEGFTLASIWEANAIPRPPAKRSVAMGLINESGVT